MLKAFIASRAPGSDRMSTVFSRRASQTHTGQSVPGKRGISRSPQQAHGGVVALVLSGHACIPALSCDTTPVWPSRGSLSVQGPRITSPLSSRTHLVRRTACVQHLHAGVGEATLWRVALALHEEHDVGRVDQRGAARLHLGRQTGAECYEKEAHAGVSGVRGRSARAPTTRVALVRIYHLASIRASPWPCDCPGVVLRGPALEPIALALKGLAIRPAMTRVGCAGACACAQRPLLASCCLALEGRAPTAQLQFSAVERRAAHNAVTVLAHTHILGRSCCPRSQACGRALAARRGRPARRPAAPRPRARAARPCGAPCRSAPAARLPATRRRAPTPPP